MSDFTPTDCQRAAIETVGLRILVSAGAGSGKTAVLAERCAYLVADARPPCPVDRLLVVTFTDAAAAEMRQRIGQALRERLAKTPTNAWLQRQLALLETASISTIHSFCRQVLNRYFAQADLDPQAPVMDANDASLLRQETARRIFDRFGDRRDATGEAFLDFVAAYGGRSEESLIARVLSVDAFLSSIPNPAKWIQDTTDRYAIDPPGRRKTQSLPDQWTSLLRDTLRRELDEQLQTVQTELQMLANAPPTTAKSKACLVDYAEALRAWLGRLPQDGDAAAIDRLCREGIGAYEFPPAPRKPGVYKDWPPQEQAAFSTAADAVRNIGKKLFEKRLLDSYGHFTTAEWAEGIARTSAHVRIFLSLVAEIRKAYQQAKRELGAVDFNDLERMTLDLLRDETAGVASRLRDYYDHVLVDEFQDVNAVQAEILRLVSRQGEPARPDNLFAVGDVKQSIYRFRLAEPRLFLDRQTAGVPYTPQAVLDAAAKSAGVVIDLQENFRSNPCILDEANAVFERLMAPDFGGIAYDEHAKLKRPPPKEGAVAPPPFLPLELHLLDKVAAGGDAEENESGPAEALDWEQIQREAYVIARRIQGLVAEGTPYGDITILLRSMQPRAGLLLRTLSQLGVPVFADSAGGFFDAMEVLDLLSLLELLDNEQQDIPLASLLRSPLTAPPLTDDELAAIRCAPSASPADVPFHAAVHDYAEHGSDEPLRSRLTAVLARLADWRDRARRRPLADVLWEIYEESGYLAYVAGLRDGAQRRANLVRLHEYARQFGTFKRQGLNRFLQFVNGLREAGEDLDAGSVVSASQDVVRVMTIHRAKGLQFPVVIVGEFGKRFNLSDARGSILFDRRLGLAMEAVDVERRIRYPTLPHRLVAQAAEVESLAEELRVLYVALTRAKQRLILVGTGSLRSLEKDRQRYAGHQGVLPIMARRTAQSMLDWVTAAMCCSVDRWCDPDVHRDFSHPPSRESLPVAPGGMPKRSAGMPPERDIRTPREGSPPLSTQHSALGAFPPLFAVFTYDGGQMTDWRIDPPQRTGVAERLEQCARLAPLSEVRVENADATLIEKIVKRLTTPYPASRLTMIPSVAAASVLKRRWDIRQDDEDPAAAWDATPAAPRKHPSAAPRFPGPAFLERTRALDPTSRGTCTHEFLQRLDLRRPCDATDLRNQLDSMVAAELLSPAEAESIDLAGIVWLFTTPLGTKMRSPDTRVLREWPFLMGVDPTRYDPAAAPRDAQDFLLVRGIIDCLLDDGAGWEVLDYKTDDVTGEALTARAAEYRGQLQVYAAAVEAVWRRPVVKKWLAFLGAREMVEV